MNRIFTALLLATTFGCGDNLLDDDPATDETPGELSISITGTPDDIASIHISVTGADFIGSVDTDLIQQPDQSWLGAVLDIPPGPGRTVYAQGFDAGHNFIYEGTTHNVTVFPGKLTNIALALRPLTPPETNTNTPPHFINVIFPESILSTEPATLFAIADDPDLNTQLTYSFSVLQGGGSLSQDVVPNQVPGIPVSTVYTPVPGFTGFAVIQATATDGLATTVTTFPVAIGAGILPVVTFETPPDLTFTHVERHSLMPGDSSKIEYYLSNPVRPWTPATAHVHTTWTDSCGGSFDVAPEDIDINQGDIAVRTATYTASYAQPFAVSLCRLSLNMVTPAQVSSYGNVNVWIDRPMVMFQSSASVAGDTFGGNWQTADAFCTNLANDITSAAPPGQYMALVSFDEISAKDRLRDAPFIRVDGTPIARNKQELYSIDLLNSIRTDEHNAFNGVSAVYTGTNGDGTKGTNCANWTSTDGSQTSTAGINATMANPNWTNSGTFTCSAQLPIYCVQKPNFPN